MRYDKQGLLYYVYIGDLIAISYLMRQAGNCELDLARTVAEALYDGQHPIRGELGERSN